MKHFPASFLALLAGCASEAGLLPEAEKQTVTGFATEVCSRRIAQRAAPYRAKGVTSVVNDEASLLPNDRYRLDFQVTIDYGSEKRTARIECIVTNGGQVESVEEIE